MSVSNILSTSNHPNLIPALTLPKMSQTNRNQLTPPQNGMCIYNIDNQSVEFYVGEWKKAKTGTAEILQVTQLTDVNIINGSTLNPFVGNTLVSVQSGTSMDLNNGGVVVNEDGIYKFYAFVTLFSSSRLSAGTVSLSLRNLDGSTKYFVNTNVGYATPNTVSLNQFCLNISGCVQLSANDTLAVYVQNLGTSSTLVVNGESVDHPSSYFYVEKIN